MTTSHQQQQQNGTSPATQATNRPINAGPVNGRLRNNTAADSHPVYTASRPRNNGAAIARLAYATTVNTRPTKNGPVNAGPMNAGPVNSQTPPATSNDNSNNPAANPTPAQAQAFASSQAGIAMNPINAAHELETEEWEHMMELSTVFRNHVNHMLVELDNEQDIVDDFGLGALRSQPFGSWHDY